MATPSTSRSGNASTEREDLRQALAEKLIEQIGAGTARWQKPWEPGEVLAPVNAVTGKPYRGVNREWLSVFSPDHSDPRWCTYKQAKEQGWQVREGEKGTRIEVWKEYEHKRTQEELETIRAERGKMDPAVLEKLGEIPLVEKRLGVRYYSVFHASQIDGIPPLERPDIDHEVEGKPDERLPKLAAAMGVSLQYGGGRAFYRTASDHVQMPPVETFEKAVGHDTTLLHELSHATGHESRLSRKLGNPFGSPEYAVEELRAEMSAAMTAASLGLGFDPAAQDVEQDRELGNSAAYLASWLKALPENERKQTIMQAIKDAQVISDYLLERTPEIERTVELAQREMSTTVPEKLVPWLSNSQRLATEEGLRGEDRSFFAEKMQELERIIEKMPITYDTDGKPDAEKPVGLRYFGPGGAQWFIIEKDRGDPEREGPGEPRQLQAFGLADLRYGEPEIGYINIEEITKNPRVELDYHFEPTNLLEIKKEHYPDMVRRIAMGESVVQEPEIGVFIGEGEYEMATNQLMQRNNLVNAFIDVNDDKTKAALADARNQVGEAEWKKGFSPETQKVARDAMKAHGARYETELKGRLVDVQTAQTQANGEAFSKLRVTLENDAGKITLSEDLNSEFAQRLVTKLDTASREHAGQEVTIGGFASPVERDGREFVDHVATMKDAAGKEIPAAPDHFKLAKENVDIAQEALKGSKLGEEKKKKMLNQVAKSAREEYFDSVASTFHDRFVERGIAPQKQERESYPALESGIRQPDGNWMNLSLHVPTEGKEHEGQLVGTLQRKGPDGCEKAPLVFEKGEKGLEAIATFPGEEPLKVSLSKSEYGKAEVTITRDGEPIHERPALLRQNEALKSIPNHREGQLLQQSLGVNPSNLEAKVAPARAPAKAPEKSQGQSL